MRRWIVSLVAGAVLAACAAPAPPSIPVVQGASSPGPAPGLAFARTTCAACHAVEAGEMRSPNPAAPPFEAVPATSGMTAMAFGAWMRSSHPSMPDLILTQKQIDDVWSYIESLNGRDRT